MSIPRPAWLVSIVLAACATTPDRWDKPGATAAALEQDSQECRMQASLSPMPQHYAPAPSGPATLTSGIVTRREQLAVYETEQFQKCMGGKGYSLTR